MKTSIIPAAAAQEWNKFVERSFSHDFYHCRSYQQLDNTGTPFLFVTEDEQGDFIALPLIKRPINGTDYFDCTSVYGYPGPISSKAPAQLPADLSAAFRSAFLSYLKQERFVSALTRMHPIIEQVELFDDLGEVVYLNKTVAIDLTAPPEVQRTKYRKSNKSEINQLRRNGNEVRKATTEAEIDEFVDIYTKTMQRVNAVDYYFFDKAYFHNFLSVDDFKAFLLLAWKENEITAGAIFTQAGNIMQYHLAGTKEQYMKETPMKLIIDEARLMGTADGMQHLHLGGGVGGSDEDPLYRFKSGFSDLNFTYKIWKLIVDNDRYEELVAARAKGKDLTPNYFPRYRG